MSFRVNEVNGENLQDPPIKNPGYANDQVWTTGRTESGTMRRHALSCVALRRVAFRSGVNAALVY